MRRSYGAGLWLCCLDKGENTNNPEHQICRKGNGLNSYTVRRIKIKNGFRIAMGHAVVQLGEALRYKPEVRGFDSDSVSEIFHLYNTSGRIIALGSTQSLTERSTINITWEVKAVVA
jgi:hypothetical protein